MVHNASGCFPIAVAVVALILAALNDGGTTTAGGHSRLSNLASHSSTALATRAYSATSTPTFTASPSSVVAPASSTPVTTPSASVRVTVDLSAPEAVSRFSTGVTYTQFSLDSWGDAAAVARGRMLLASSTRYQNQQMMGWGVSNPEPSPGVYDWSSLDRRLQLMRDTGAIPVITFCCAPGWMRPHGYQDDWAYLETAPDPAHVQDFADLARAVAIRYPDVKYFQVWNELKGMWGTAPGCTPWVCGQNRWDYERYTTLYNAVYDAVKSARPDAQFGGPYVVVATFSSRDQSKPSSVSGPYGVLDQRPLDVIRYWLAHKRGADFITIDGKTKPADGVWASNEFTAGEYFVDVHNWLRSLDDSRYPGARTLPLWWAEWYASSPQDWRDLDHYNAVMASALAYTVRSGASVALIWKPQGDAQGFAHPEGIWTDSSLADGGQATPFYHTLKALNDFWGPGVPIYRVVSSEPAKVVGIATQAKTMLINKTTESLAVYLNGQAPITLGAYSVVVLDTPGPSR